MIDAKLEKAINEQINAELYSEYIYLAMKTYFKENNLQGFANWFEVQVQEEHAHAMGLYDYIIERGGHVELMPIEAPTLESDTIIGLFEQTLKHEMYVTKRINDLADVAESVSDKAAISFIDWYVKEQVEEEANVNNILKTLKFIGDDKHALLMFDKDLMTRVYVQPTIG
jgi:ferritin